MTFNSKEFGLGELERGKIKKVIEENTSVNFEQHAKKRNARIREKVEHFNSLIAKFTPQQILKAQLEIDKCIEKLEEERDLSRIALHIDMDAFYAAVEMRDNPSLRVIPMAVGSDSMLCTSNYIARKYGVRSAMPGFIARKLCPALKIIPCNFTKYGAASQKVREIFKEYDANCRMGSLDEAYLDITDYMASRNLPVKLERIRYCGGCICLLPHIPLDSNDFSGSVKKEICQKCKEIRTILTDMVTFGTKIEDVVQEIRFRVEQSTGLTCSAGIAANSMIAKICSDSAKPNGQFRVACDKKSILEFMKTLQLRKVNGIGAVTEEILKGIGIEKCGDLYDKRAIINLLFSPNSVQEFMCIALGISQSYSVESWGNHKRKSISQETTFRATSDWQYLSKTLHSLCNELIDSLEHYKLKGGRSATLKIKFSTFDVVTRCTSVDYIIHDSENLFLLCEHTLKAELDAGKNEVRLLGVRLSNLVFEDETSRKWRSIPLEQFWSNLKPAEKKCRIQDLDVNESIECIDSHYYNVSKFSKPCDLQCGTSDILTTDNSKKNETPFEPRTGFFGAEMLQNESEILTVAHSTSSDQGINEDYRCPICNFILSTNLLKVNEHIDDCLNRLEIERIHQNEQSSSLNPCSVAASKKRKKFGDKQKRQKNIMSYFSPLKKN